MKKDERDNYQHGASRSSTSRSQDWPSKAVIPWLFKLPGVEWEIRKVRMTKPILIERQCKQQVNPTVVVKVSRWLKESLEFISTTTAHL